MNEAKKKKRNFAITVMLIIMTFALCITLISCGGDDELKDTDTAVKTEKNVDDEKDEKVANTDSEAADEATQKSTIKATQKVTTDSTKSTTAKATTAATEAKKVCYITIEGYCSGKEMSLQGGDTVYSILCRSGAAVSGSGHYIKGINGRFEFDEGPGSGWTYYVNGSKPTVGCGSCSVKAGDNIRWDYVTSY